MPNQTEPGRKAPDQGIDYFNRGHWLTALKNRASFTARRRMFDVWRNYAGASPGKTLLDVGATPDLELIYNNCMIPWFHDMGLAVSLYSPEDIRALSASFPWVNILPTQGFGSAIPAKDRSFDWVTSSAVLEHVGGAQQQVAFLRDCARIGDALFFTTPNRGHWLEFHTILPFLHWLPRRWHRAALRALGQTLWAQESHLRLVTAGELRAMAADALGEHFTFEVRRIWALGMPSNLILLARRRPT
jgi:hypothetical protein